MVFDYQAFGHSVRAISFCAHDQCKLCRQLGASYAHQVRPLLVVFCSSFWFLQTPLGGELSDGALHLEVMNPGPQEEENSSTNRDPEKKLGLIGIFTRRTG